MTAHLDILMSLVNSIGERQGISLSVLRSIDSKQTLIHGINPLALQNCILNCWKMII